MTTRNDERLDDAPMQALQCQRCSARVQVRKSSWQQTSVQWDTAARETCLERRTAARGPGANGDFFDACSALSESIRQAATAGALAIPDDGF